jgi:tetratricopeptide (TPR) repeat protein
VLPNAPTTFFSYSRENSKFALRLAQDLKAAGANVWIDQLDIRPGQEWDSAIEIAMTQSPQVLLILSPSSVTSRNVRNEITFALDEKKTIIPVLYQDCTVPLQLRRVQYVDFKTDYSRGLQVLLRTLGVEDRKAVARDPTVQGDVADIPLFPNYAKNISRPIPPVPIPPEPPLPPEPWRRLSFKVLGASILIVSLSFAVTWSYRHYYIPPQTTMAVWGFQVEKTSSANDSKGSNPSSTATGAFDNALAAEANTTLYDTLRAQGGLKLVANDYVKQIRSLSGMSPGQGLTKDQVPNLLGALGAGAVIAGKFRIEGSGADQRITFVCDVIGPYGNNVKSFSNSGPIADRDSIVTALASQLRAWQGKGNVDQESIEQLRFLYPKRQETRVAYFSGVSDLDKFDGQKAKSEFEKALRDEPDNILINEGFADAEGLLGHDPEARKYALKALDLANDANRDQNHPKITQETHLVASARAAESQSLWKIAADDYRTLRQSSAQPLEYGLKLASVLMFSNDGEDLIAALAVLDDLEKTWPTDSRINLLRAGIFSLQGALEKAMAAAAKAYELASQQNLSFAEAEADIHICWVTQKLQGLSNPALPSTRTLLEKFRDACTQASDIFGNHDAVAQAVIMNQNATRLVSQGLFEQAVPIYDFVIKVTSDGKSAQNEAGARLNKASVLIQLGSCDDAKTLLKTSLDRSIEANDMYDHRRALLLTVNADMCKKEPISIDEAVRQTERVLQDADIATDASAKAYALDSLGNYQLELGLFAAAMTSYQQASDLHSSTGEIVEAVAGTSNIGDVLFRQGKFAEAEKQYQKALAMVPESEKFRRAQVWLALGNLGWAKGDSEEANKYSSQAWDALKNSLSKELVSEVASVRVKALILGNRREEAQQYLQNVNAPNIEDPDTLIEGRMASALYLWGGAEDERAKALVLLDEAIKKGHETGLVFDEFQAKLLRYKLIRQHGGVPSSMASEVTQFAQHAHAIGFLGIERDARKL